MSTRKRTVDRGESGEKVRRSVLRKGIARSAPVASSQLERLLTFAGVVNGAPSNLSEEVDEGLYAGDKELDS